MQSNRSRALIALAAVALVVVAFFLIRGDEEAGEGSSVTADETTTTTGDPSDGDTSDEKPEKERPEKPDVPVIEIVDGAPKGGVTELEFELGDQITFAVTSNTDQEIHVHGYEIEEEIPTGQTVDVSFPADLDGIYEVESHTTGQQIAELRVNP